MLRGHRHSPTKNSQALQYAKHLLPWKRCAGPFDAFCLTTERKQRDRDAGYHPAILRVDHV